MKNIRFTTLTAGLLLFLTAAGGHPAWSAEQRYLNFDELLEGDALGVCFPAL